MGTHAALNARHETNAIRKARLAVEVVETDLLWLWKDDPAFPEVTDLHTCLSFTHWVLFGSPRHENPQLVAAVWAIIGGFYSINNKEDAKVTVFDTSRPFIASELLNRARETRPQVAEVGDPFAGLGFGPGGNMSDGG